MKTKTLFTLILALSFINLFATNFNVTNGNDSGTGSFRQATLDANADATASTTVPHTITFDGAYTIALTSQLTINNHVVVNATGTYLVTISAASAARCMNVSDNKTVTLNYIVFQNASATASTALGVGSNSSATINNCTFQNNGAIIGVITSYGSIYCNSCLFRNNASSDASKALIYQASAANTLSFSNCIFENNVTQVPIIKVPAFTGGSTALNITNCVFRNNANSGAAFNHGSAVSSAGITTITNTEFSGNTAQRGPAVFIPTGNATYKSKLTMTNCTVSGNTATAYASGIYIQGTTNTDFITLTNCTISGNSSVGDGGGLAGDATTTYTLNNCTFTGNSSNGNGATSTGAGIRLWNGTLILNYSIIAGNNTLSTATGKDINLATSVILGSTTGRNLYGGTQTFGQVGAVTTNNVEFSGDITTVLNTTLTDNSGTTALPGGGYVKTHALIAGSLAINSSISASGLQSVDQRGYLRDATPDMGAYEFNGTVTSLNNSISKAVPIYKSGLNTLVIDLTGLAGVQIITFYDVNGRKVITHQANGGEKITINTGLKKGIYLAHILGNEKPIISKLIID